MVYLRDCNALVAGVTHIGVNTRDNHSVHTSRIPCHLSAPFSWTNSHTIKSCRHCDISQRVREELINILRLVKAQRMRCIRLALQIQQRPWFPHSSIASSHTQWCTILPPSQVLILRAWDLQRCMWRCQDVVTGYIWTSSRIWPRPSTSAYRTEKFAGAVYRR